MPQRRVRPAGAARGARRPAGPTHPGGRRSTRRGRRRSRSRCCSAGSPSTCTRATRRWPSVGPRRSRSTATCCATCSAPRSCASCSTRSCWPTSSSSCSAWSTAAGPATPTRLHDLLRLLGPLTLSELDARADDGHRRRARRALGRPLVAERRAIRVAIAGEERIAAAEDAARLRDALGVALPPGLPTAFTDPVDDPLVDLVARFARTHGPFLTAQVAHRFGLGVDRVAARARGARGAGSHRAGRVPPRRHRARVVRRRRAPPAPPALAGRAAAGGRAGRRRGAGPLPARVAGRRRRSPWPRRAGRGHRLAPGRGAAASVLEADVLPARVRGLPAGRPRRALHRGRGGVGRRRPARRDRRPGAAVFRDQAGAAGAADADDERPEGPAAARRAARAPGAERARRSGPTWSRAAAVGRASPTTTRRARRAVGPGVGGRGHQRLPRPAAVDGRRQAAARAVPAESAARAPGARRPNLGRPTSGAVSRSVRRPAAVAGRWSRRCCEPAPPPTEAAHARALQLLERYGVLTREAALAEGIEGGFAGGVPGAQGARGAGPGAARLLRGRPRRRPVRPARRGRPPPLGP